MSSRTVGHIALAVALVLLFVAWGTHKGTL